METLGEGWPASNLIAHHVYLEETLGDGDGGNFLSGWQCINPWQPLMEREIAAKRGLICPSAYLYTDDFPEIEQSFIDLHQSIDDCLPESILFGAGSTQLLLLATVWIRCQKIDEVFYIAPMYHTLHWALKTLGIRARPINGRHPFESDFSFNLPEKKAALILTNPVWYSGVRMQDEVMEKIAKWQLTTGSLVILDGSFQYMEWSHATKNRSWVLDPSLTIRVICPTKQLILHGYRASYALVPRSWHREIATLNSMMFASLSIDTVAFLMTAPDLIKQEFSRKLMSLAAHRHARLREDGAIAASWLPDCGYFCFERLNERIGDQPLMNGEYFDQARYPDHYRINLLSPQIAMLCGDVDSGFSV